MPKVVLYTFYRPCYKLQYNGVNALTLLVRHQERHFKNLASAILKGSFLEELRTAGLTWSDLWKTGSQTKAKSNSIMNMMAVRYDIQTQQYYEHDGSEV